jgi:predicted acylesterase/phospholipase RssA
MAKTPGEWWYEQPSVKYHLAGVFEGGGAKGVAYIGVLERLAEECFWFRRVAGSSAGALAAALVASGATTTEIRAGMGQLLAPIKKLAARKVRRLTRLYWHGGMYSNRVMHIWLENWLAHQARGIPIPPETADPSLRSTPRAGHL